MCSKTFDCLNTTGAMPTKETLQEQIATASGDPQVKSWCHFQANWDNIVKSCLVDRDLRRSAREVFHQVLSKHPQDEEDAKYCFLSGHCQDSVLDSNSTLEDATRACNQRYPEPHGWKSIGFADLDITQPLTTKARADQVSKISCARGGFHCSVAYCQEVYCQMDRYKERFGFLARAQTM